MSNRISEQPTSRAQRAHDLLKSLLDLLSEQDEHNWSRGILAALLELTSREGGLNPTGFDNAASIYRGMTSGGRGFAEYSIWLSDDVERIRANQGLDDLRDALWNLFDT